MYASIWCHVLSSSRIDLQCMQIGSSSRSSRTSARACCNSSTLVWSWVLSDSTALIRRSFSFSLPWYAE